MFQFLRHMINKQLATSASNWELSCLYLYWGQWQ